MTAPSPGGFLDFFILEAGDYIEQLDALLLSGGARLDAEALQRGGRALRGSATMARLPALSELAGGVERVGRAVREGQLEFTTALRGVLVAAVDDLKLLLRHVREWSAADDARARTRIDELVRYAPIRPATPLTAPTTAAHDGFLATESANIGAGLELLATRPTDRDAATNVLRRVRALRGIASVKDHAALSDVLEAAEHAAHPLELGEPTLSAEQIALLGTAATVLRGVAVAIRGGTSIEQANPDLTRFAAALDAMQERETGADRVVPIASFFYEDGGVTVVDATLNPPTSPGERFRMEVVSLAEHLRRVLGDARAARDQLARERVRRALRGSLRALGQAAESFGESDVAAFVAAYTSEALRLEPAALDALEQAAVLLAQPSPGQGTLGGHLRAIAPRPGATPAEPATARRIPTPSRTLTPVMSSSAIAPPSLVPQERDRPAAAALAEAAGSVVAAAATAASAVAATAASTVAAGAGALVDLLDSGIRTLGTLHHTPLGTPIAVEEQPPVPIERLLYRGRSALLRARELRTEVTREQGGVDAEKLQELFDLLDLALTS